MHGVGHHKSNKSLLVCQVASAGCWIRVWNLPEARLGVTSWGLGILRICL